MYWGFWSFGSLSSKLYDNFIETLVIALHGYYEDSVKYGLLSKHLFQRKQQSNGWKNLKETKNFYK